MFGSQQRRELGRVFHDASAEAQRMGDNRVGTEHVTLALLSDPDSATARALGVSLIDARQALQSLDSTALAAVGIGAVDPGPVEPTRQRIRLTPATRQLFQDLREPKPSGPQQVLLGLLERRSPDPAAELLDQLGVDRAQVRARLHAS